MKNTRRTRKDVKCFFKLKLLVFSYNNIFRYKILVLISTIRSTSISSIRGRSISSIRCGSISRT